MLKFNLGRKKFIFALCFCIPLIFISCSDNVDNIKKGEVASSESNKQLDIPKDALYEFEYEDLFVIKKISNGEYSFVPKHEHMSLYIYTKTDKGFIFSYNTLVDDKGEYAKYICNFDEDTRMVTKLVDVSKFNYSQSLSTYNRIFYGGYTENRFVLLDISPSEVKEILVVEGFHQVEIVITHNNLLINYKVDDKEYLKVMNLKDNKILDVYVEDYKNINETITHSYENGGKIYYCLYKGELDSDKGEYELVEYSLKDNKTVNKFPLKNGFSKFIVKDDIFVYSEMDKDGVQLTEDMYIAKKAGNFLEEIEVIRDVPYGIFGDHIDEDTMLFVTEGQAYKYDTKKLELEKFVIYSGESASEGRRKLVLLDIIDKEILVIKKSEEEVTFEFRNFDELKKEYRK